MADTRTIRLPEAKIYLKHHFNGRQPAMLWGPPGIGKSALIQEIVDDWKEQGKKALLVDVRLPLWEPTDIKGIPYFDSNDGTMRWAAPSELPSEEIAAKYDVIALFLDELNGAAPAVQAAAYQLVLNRRVGEYYLPDNVVMVAAGNRESDKGVTYRMPKPLANRLLHYELRHDFNDWVEWASANTISPDVVGYLTWRKDDLMKFDPKSSDRSFPTPRSWEFVSNLLLNSDGFSVAQVADMVAAAIGEGTALQFNNHRKVSAKLPNPTDILLGRVHKLETKEISAMYSLATSLAYELRAAQKEVGHKIDQDKMNDYLNNTIGFWMDHFEPEMTIMSFRMILPHKYGITFDIKKIKNWKVFFERHGNLVKAA